MRATRSHATVVLARAIYVQLACFALKDSSRVSCSFQDCERDCVVAREEQKVEARLTRPLDKGKGNERGSKKSREREREGRSA